MVPLPRGAQGWEHRVSILQCGWCLRSIPGTPATCQHGVDVAGAHGVFGKMDRWVTSSSHSPASLEVHPGLGEPSRGLLTGFLTSDMASGGCMRSGRGPEPVSPGQRESISESWWPSSDGHPGMRSGHRWDMR